ncbi:alpha/beta hydrolase [Mycolicibacterium komossense]|uniref:Alpha/beta hydrolase n=2 Tax=Mycolicibacterium komossense TaxID=1779 RepID=A0ABT3CA74_9MYCO|nr:alpha/beta hydrolase [Mycolicibacterium komossense]
MSGLLAEAPNPRATIVAIHGGATTALYFDCPGFPALSLLRTGTEHGFTVLAIDRPGFGSSALYADEFTSTPKRIDAAYGTIDTILGTRDRGAGVFLLAHSAGCELALRMAADERGDALLGIEISGTGVRQQQEAMAILSGASIERIPTGLRQLLWEPAHLYADGVDRAVRIQGGPAGVRYEASVVSGWARDLPDLAALVQIPVRFSLGAYERVWETGPAALTEVAALFTAAPQVVVHEQAEGGHNLSLGHTAADYHASVLTFVEQCTTGKTTDFTMEGS